MPCATPFCADVRVDVNGVHETEATDGSDKARRGRGRVHVDVLQGVEAGSEVFAESKGAGHQVLIEEDVERGAGDGTGERVTTVGGAVLTGLDAILNCSVSW